MRYATLGLLLMLLSGCVRAPIEARQDPYPAHQVNMASPELANFTAVGTVRMYRQNGILYVTVPIRSASDFDLHVDYRITFFDAQGRTIYQSGWEGHKTLVRNIPSEISFNSLSGDAADFQLDLRYSQ